MAGVGVEGAVRGADRVHRPAQTMALNTPTSRNSGGGARSPNTPVNCLRSPSTADLNIVWFPLGAIKVGRGGGGSSLGWRSHKPSRLPGPQCARAVYGGRMHIGECGSPGQGHSARSTQRQHRGSETDGDDSAINSPFSVPGTTMCRP